MADKNTEYWRERMEQLEDAQNRKGAEYYAELQKQYDRTSRAIEKEINNWYLRFADNNEISMQEARKLLNSSELEEFRWSVQEYIEKGRSLKLSDQWMKQLENVSAKFHISRLEAIKLQIQNYVEVLYGSEQDSFTDCMERIYTDGYYHTAYEIQRGVGIGYSMMKLDKSTVKRVISKPWAADKKNFSTRIWEHKSQLITELHNNLTQAIMMGKSPHQVTKEIAKRMGVSRSQAGRLVMTETAYFHSLANLDCYKDLDVEEYEIIATLDIHTSEICRSMDGRHFPLGMYQPGVTAPPFHCWCRSTTAPYFNDEFEIGTQRAARNEDGKTYYVPADMKYNEWYDSFVEENKSGLQEIKVDDKMNVDEPVVKQTHSIVDRPIIEQGEIIRQAEVFGTDLLNHPELIEYDNGEPISNYVNKKIGFDAPPKVVSGDEFARLSDGKPILYRGVTDYKDISAQNMVDQFKYGKFYCGRGVYGNGTYADYDEKVAMYYAYDSGDTSNGEIMEMLLSDDVKTVSFLDIYAEYKKTGIPKLIAHKRETFQDIIGNVGTYAAIKGYDAILLDGFENKYHVVILNRSKVIVKE